MIRVAALLCVCSLALAACYGGGTRAAIVRSSTPVPVCLDGRDADTPSWRRICPSPVSKVAAVSRRIGATRLRTAADLAPWDMRRSESLREAARQAYIERVILRRETSARPPPPSDAPGAIDASLLAVPAVDPALPVLPFAPSGLALRGSLD